MKSIYFTVLFLLSFSILKAQNVADAVRFSQQDITGTARYKGVSGAFGALGGDLSSINNNPAGSAIFNESTAAVTASVDIYKNDTRYFNGATSTDNSDLNFSQLGGTFILNNNKETSPWRKIAFTLNYDRTANYDNQYTATGSSTSSIDGYFLGNAQGFKLEDLRQQGNESITGAYRDIGNTLGYQAQQGFLGFQGYIIEPTEDNPTNTNYISAIAAGNFDQEFTSTTHGYASKITLNAATQYGERFFFGLNLSSHFIDYTRRTAFSEDNANAGSSVTNVLFRNYLSTLGNGFSFQAGAIYKVSPNLRLGAGYDSPVWYGMDDEVSQSLFTDGADGNASVAPDVITVFDRYNFHSPSKYNGSIAYIFENIGFLSFDYSYQDFSNIQFKTNNTYDFGFQNSSIDQQLQAVSTYRVGGEYRIKQLSLRGGYRFEDSPYKDGFAVGDLSGFSVGLGYAFGSTRLDVTYARDTRNLNPRFYDGGFTNYATIDRTNSSVVATLSFRL